MRQRISGMSLFWGGWVIATGGKTTVIRQGKEQTRYNEQEGTDPKQKCTQNLRVSAQVLINERLRDDIGQVKLHNYSTHPQHFTKDNTINAKTITHTSTSIFVRTPIDVMHSKPLLQPSQINSSPDLNLNPS